MIFPEFDRTKLDNCSTLAVTPLDLFTDKYPDTPVYFVVIKRTASPLFYQALVCIYVGYFHAITGWNIEDKDVISWELIKGYSYKDFAGVGHYKNRWTLEEYELIKNKSVKTIIREVTNMENKRGPRDKATTKLKALRVSLGFTQSDVATKAGLNLRTYQYYEQGNKPIEGAKLEVLLKICLVLGCKLDQIIDDPELVGLIKEYE